MSIQNAISCIQKIQKQPDFRQELYKNKTREEVEKFVESKNLIFSYIELCEAYRLLLVQCQTEEQADSLKHTMMMYQLLADIQLDLH